MIFCPPMNGGFPTNRIEPRRPSSKHLRELQRPVERRRGASPAGLPRVEHLARLPSQLLDQRALARPPQGTFGIERTRPSASAHRAAPGPLELARFEPCGRRLERRAITRRSAMRRARRAPCRPRLPSSRAFSLGVAMVVDEATRAPGASRAFSQAGRALGAPCGSRTVPAGAAPCPRAGIEVEPLRSARARDAQERVAAPQRVVEEGEGTLPLEGHEPQRELRHLDGHGVLVDAVEAAVGHEPPRHHEPLVQSPRAGAAPEGSPFDGSPSAA